MNIKLFSFIVSTSLLIVPPSQLLFPQYLLLPPCLFDSVVVVLCPSTGLWHVALVWSFLRVRPWAWQYDSLFLLFVPGRLPSPFCSPPRLLFRLPLPLPFWLATPIVSSSSYVRRQGCGTSHLCDRSCECAHEYASTIRCSCYLCQGGFHRHFVHHLDYCCDCLHHCHSGYQHDFPVFIVSPE